jgi:hypothetical protein
MNSMPDKQPFALTCRFAFNHIESDGKYVNLTEALEAMDADHVCLALTNGPVDPPILDDDTINHRFTRLQTIIQKLRRRGITADLVMPSLTDRNPAESKTKSYRDQIFTRAAQLKIRTLWVDDSYAPHHSSFNRSNFIATFRHIRQLIQRQNPHLPVALIAADPRYYSYLNLTANELVGNLTSVTKPILAQAQPLNHDYNRTDILNTIHTLAITRAYADSFPLVRQLGSIDQTSASEFHKSAEATQMQFNLNLLFGCRDIIFNGFDNLGGPPGLENPYLEMLQKSDSLLRKLAKLLPNRPAHQGLAILVPKSKNPLYKGKLQQFCGTNPNSADAENCHLSLANLLRRCGLPIALTAPKSALELDCPFILSGSLPQVLSKKELKHIFHHGVLLDATAARTLQELGCAKLLGCKVGKPLRNIQLEILSDQMFAAPYYGRRTLLSPPWPADCCVDLQPTHKDARFITTLQRPGKIPNIPGMVVFDDNTHNHRCVILPYDLRSWQDDRETMLDPLLTTFRKRHFQDLFQWLHRKQLPCLVENTPDLIPFYSPIVQKRRILLALLNVSFDWAIDVRIRFGQLPFKVKRVRELDEQGQLVEYSDLRFTVSRDYQYLQLNSDTAVAPMQMTILILDTP